MYEEESPQHHGLKSEVFYENKLVLVNISTKFHNTLCEIISEVSKKSGIKNIALSGGCFQNKYLLERSIKLLKNNGLKVYHNNILPCNDGGISAGQLFGYLKKTNVTLSHKIFSKKFKVLV